MTRSFIFIFSENFGPSFPILLLRSDAGGTSFLNAGDILHHEQFWIVWAWEVLNVYILSFWEGKSVLDIGSPGVSQREGKKLPVHFLRNSCSWLSGQLSISFPEYSARCLGKHCPIPNKQVAFSAVRGIGSPITMMSLFSLLKGYIIYYTHSSFVFSFNFGHVAAENV